MPRSNNPSASTGEGGVQSGSTDVAQSNSTPQYMCSRSELVHYIYLAIPGSIDTIVSDLFTPSFREGWCRSLFLPLVAHVQQYNTVEISLFVARCWCYCSLLTIFSGKQWPFPM